MIKILATDLDRTLLPNGKWEGDKDAIPKFNELCQKHNLVVVYVTGRSLLLTEKAVAEFGIAYPNILCSDVGTKIYKYQNNQWITDEGWPKQIMKLSPRWSANSIKESLAMINNLVEQGEESQNQFKQSYFIEGSPEDVIAQVKNQIGGKYDEEIVFSHDPQNNTGLLDVLAASATKQTVLEYIADEYSIPYNQLVFCGDSGNDALPLTANFKGVMVKNADSQLVEQVEIAKQKNPNLQIYHAQGNFQGLNGYYASGVIEGAFHYGLFS